MPADPHKKVPDWRQLSDKPLIGAAIPRIVLGNKDTENNRGSGGVRGGAAEASNR